MQEALVSSDPAVHHSSPPTTVRHDFHQQCLWASILLHAAHLFCGGTSSLNRTPFCGKVSATLCFCVPTWQGGASWLPNAMPNAGAVGNHQPCVEESAAVAFPGTSCSPSCGAPAQDQGRNETSQCELGRCAPPVLCFTLPVTTFARRIDCLV